MYKIESKNDLIGTVPSEFFEDATRILEQIEKIRVLAGELGVFTIMAPLKGDDLEIEFNTPKDYVPEINIESLKDDEFDLLQHNLDPEEIKAKLRSYGEIIISNEIPEINKLINDIRILAAKIISFINNIKGSEKVDTFSFVAEYVDESFDAVNGNDWHIDDMPKGDSFGHYQVTFGYVEAAPLRILNATLEVDSLSDADMPGYVNALSNLSELEQLILNGQIVGIWSDTVHAVIRQAASEGIRIRFVFEK